MSTPHIMLSEGDRSYLVAFLKKGSLGVKHYKRATGLLELDRGKRLTAVAAALGVGYRTVSAWQDAYQRDGSKSSAPLWPEAACNGASPHRNN